VNEAGPAVPRPRLLFALLFLAAAGLLSHQIAEPWVGKHEGWNGALFSTAAHNHLAYGLGVTRLGVTLNGDHATPGTFLYYTNHPPLLPLVLAASFAVFGEHEWSARLVPVLFTLLSVVLVWRIGVEVRGPAFGLLAALFFTLLPMNAFYGRMVDHEALTGAFSLGAIWLYVRWQRTRRTALLGGSMLSLALGMASGWPAFYLAGFLPLHHLLTAERGRRDLRVLGFPVLALAGFVLFVAHVSWLRGSGGVQELISQFVLRTSAGTADFTEGRARSFSWPGFALLWAVRSYKLFTLPILAAAALELWNTWTDRRGPLAFGRGIVLVLLVFGITHMLLFRQGAWVHEYWGFYLSAPLAFLAAGGLLGLAHRGNLTRLLVFFLVLFLGASLPRLRALYADDDAKVMGQSRIIGAHARPGEIVSTNEGFMKPQIAYYTRRDVIETPLWSPEALVDTLERRPPRPVAFFLVEGEPESPALEAWLGPRYPSETDSVDVRRYRIFHIPARNP
jgi:4-amino-4-deoxy-L-arabinose transferase-like glycosyltransferase